MAVAKLKPRAQDILETSVRDYIQTGEPITSERLFRNYDFGIKPAMIRWELNSLSDRDFFYQEHPSGGRFPTRKAYRFFVHETCGDPIAGKHYTHYARSLAEEIEHDALRLFADEAAEMLGLLSGIYKHEDDLLYQSGLRKLFDHFDRAAQKDALGILGDCEDLCDRMEMFSRVIAPGQGKNPRVFIGKNRLMKHDALSLVTASFECDGELYSIIAIGPNRMDYEKTVGVFHALQDIFET